MGSTVGDVGVKLGMDERDLLRGEQRVVQSLNEMKAVVEQLGRTIDKSMSEAAARMEQAARATIEYAEAQKRAEAEARKGTEEAKRGAAEANKAAADKKRAEADFRATQKKLRDQEMQEQRAATQQAEALAKQEAAAKKQAAEQAAAAERKAAQEAQQAAQQRQQSLANLRQSMGQVAVAAGAASAAMGLIAKSSLDAFKQETSAMMGLESVATKTVGSFDKAKVAAESLATDGMMSIVETSKAVQAGLASGFNLEETVNLINAFKDSAAFNRQSGLEFGESVSRAMEGVRMGNSVLADAAGITKNLSQILKEAGKSEQDLQRVSSDSAVRRALYNGLLREASLFQGNAAKAADSLAGAEARSNTEAFKARAAFGESLAPAMQDALNVITPLMGKLTAFIEANPELARGIFLVVGGITTMIAVTATLALGFLALNLAMGPVGWALLGIGAAIGAVAGLAISMDTTATAAQNQKDRVAELVGKYEDLRSKVDEVGISEEEHKKRLSELIKVLKELEKINPDLVSGLNLQRGALQDLNVELDKTIEKASWFRNVWNGLKESLNSTPPTAWAGIGGGNTFLPMSVVGQLANDYLHPDVGDSPEELAFMKPKNKDSFRQPIPEDPLAGQGNPFGSGAPAPEKKGAKEMSEALKAALEDLQDLQALEKTPDNLRRVLAKVREVLAQHGAELKEFEKDRDLIRQRDVTLPEQIAQAEYTEALKLLDADKTLKNLSPEQFAGSLREIRERFAAYLEQHPDQALQLDLKLKGASDEEIRAPLERWQEAMQRAQQAGIFDGMGGAESQLRALRTGLALAAGASDLNSVAQLTGQIKQLEQSLQEAAFEDRFKKIADAREQAFAGAAGALAAMQKQLATEEAKGDKTDPERVRAIKQQLLDTVLPFLEAQRTALEQLLRDTTLTTEQRVQVERELNSVKGQLYQQDIDTHRLALEAQVAAEKAAAAQIEKTRKEAEERLEAARKEAAESLTDLRSSIEDAQQQDLDHLKALQEAEEKRQAARIKGLQDQLTALERQWAKEDQRERMADLQTELANVKADTRFEYVDPITKEKTYTYDKARAAELEKQIADEKQQVERDRQRQELQDRITNEQERLEVMRTANQRAYDERQTAWQNLLALDDEQLAELVSKTDKAMGDGEDGWNGVLTKWLNTAVSTAQTKAAAITSALQSAINKAREAQDALNSIGSGGGAGDAATTAPTTDAGTPVSESYTRGNYRAFAYGGVAEPSDHFFGPVGERVKEYMVPEDYLGELAGRIARLLSTFLPSLAARITAPTMPASLGAAAAGGNTIIVSPGAVQINIQGAGDPQKIAAAVEPAAASGLQQALTAAAFNLQILNANRVMRS